MEDFSYGDGNTLGTGCVFFTFLFSCWMGVREGKAKQEEREVNGERKPANKNN